MDKSPKSPKSPSIDKINLNDITGEYEVENIEAFTTYLKQLWKDLSGRSSSHKEGIDKITFGKYYELPGLISDRLFSVFDSNNKGYLSIDDFVSNMLILFSGDFEKLVKFIFNFYDFDKDQKISKEDVRVVLSYVPLYKKTKNNLGLKFEKDKFKDRLDSQKELHEKLDKIFQQNETMDLEFFTNTTRNVNSDIFLFILVFLMEHRPFSAETVKNLENIKKSPGLSPRKPDNLIASPNLDSKLIVSQTISKSPHFKSSSKLGTNMVNPSLYKDMKFLSVVSGRKETENKESIPLTYQLKIPTKEKKEDSENLDKTNGKAQTKPGRKHLKMISEMGKISVEEENTKKYSEAQENVGLTFARPFKDSNIECSSNAPEKSPCASSRGSDSEEEDNDTNNNSNFGDEVTEGYIYKIQDNQMKKIYYRLICKDLYYYKSKDNKKHKGVHNLSGAFIKEEGKVKVNDKTMWTFTIIFPSKPRKYYVTEEAEYKKWIESVRKVIGYSDLNDLYEIKGVLGKGKFGLVKLGIHKESGRQVAVKIINKKLVSEVNVQQVKTEIDILKIAKHPNIIQLYDVFENEDTIYIIMEYCAGGDLFSYIEKRGFRLPETRAAEIIHKLCTSVYFLHQYGIVHRDLKPENILMMDDSETADIRLLDFGLGKIIGPGEYCTDPFGTFSYVAPEVLQEKPYNQKVDLFAIGVITYLLVAGFLPFDHETSEEEIARQTVYEPTPFPQSVWSTISVEARMFVDNLLSKNPDDRMNIQEVLQHKWLQKYNDKQSVVFQRRKSRELSGAEKFEVFSTVKKEQQ